MNRYQAEVAEMDRRHHWRVRTATFGGAAVLIAAALWGAGVPSAKWIDRTFSSMRADEAARPKEVIAAPSARSSVPMPASQLPADPPESTATAGTDASIAATPQPLFVTAANPGRNPNEGTARIGTNPENPQTYVVGAILANGVRFVEVYADRIVLERAGQRVTLRVSADAKVGLGERSTGISELALVGGDAVEHSAPPRQRSLTDIIRSTAHFEDERLAGLQVYPGQKSAVFASIGLKSGDIVTTIDGMPVLEAARSTQALTSLIDGAVVYVDVRRGDWRETISLDGSLVVAAYEAAEQTAAVVLPGPPH